MARYTLVEPGQDPAERLAQTQAVLMRRGWTQSIVTFDNTGNSDPAVRPQMARLFTALCDRDIHGIIAVSQVDISTFPQVYTDTLAILRARGGFLDLARDECSL
ncbi:hypothetical protein [Streptomyces aureocirculatus]|uniref:hypothetical protein n=1 Tax=Streptomyces aureocirculatus TaxID=67275 RepID=UPI000690ED68|nr:hypothetical protein [Streptomyces aureocirculatus]